MDINEAIELLEAEGFYMYRKMLNGEKQVGAELVYTPVDLCCRLILNGDTAFLDFGSGDSHDADGLKDALPTLLMQLAKERDTTNPPRVSESVVALESVFPEKLAEIEEAAERKLDFLWEGCNGYWMGLYRGAVLEINNHLRVIGVDGGKVTPKNKPADYSEADVRAGLSLQIAFDMVDEMGGLEEIQIEEEELEA